MPSDFDALIELNRGFIRSVAESDAGWFDRNLSDDFLNSNADGTLSDRAAFLAAIARPSAISGLRCEDVRIQLLGETAIVRGRTVYVRADGCPGVGRYTDVYARQGGRWLCVAADVTRG